jgi:uncharacterized membrane protein
MRLYFSVREKQEALSKLQVQGNAEFLRPLYAAISLGPLALLTEEAFMKRNNYHGWTDNALYMVFLYYFPV